MNILETYKNWFIDTPLEYLKNNPEIRLYIVVILALLFALWFLYTLWIIIRLQNDKNKHIQRIEVRFPIPSDQNQELEAISIFQSFLSSCHSLLEEERMSLEIHPVDEYITLLITTSHQNALGNISKFLSGVEGGVYIYQQC